MGKHDDIKTLKDNGYDTSDVGRGNKAVTERSVAMETGSTSKAAAAAAHDARDDMAKDDSTGVPADRHIK